MRNLSELFRHSCISRHPQHEIGWWGDRKYWLGDNEWTTDFLNPDIIKIGDDQIKFYLDKLEADVGYCDLDTTPIDQAITILAWAKETYLVVNPQTNKVHRIQHCGTYGDGFYTKDEGTTERELIIKRNDHSWSHVYLQGKRIVRCDAQLITGEKFEWMGFNIPPTGNLKYQFEYELVPFFDKGVM